MHKKVFVTGGGGGLGLAIVQRHLELGDTVWALDIRQSPECAALPGDHFHFISCDISRTDRVKAALQDLLPTLYPLDYFYSCAGIYRFEDKVPLPQTDLDQAAAMYEINTIGFLRVVQALLPALENHSVLLCVTSEAGSIAENWRCGEYSYCLSKAAQNMACALLQKHFEEQQQQVRVLCLHPGWLRTAMGGPDSFIHTESSVSPQDSALALVDIALDIDNIPKEQRYMDYLRNPIQW